MVQINKVLNLFSVGESDRMSRARRGRRRPSADHRDHQAQVPEHHLPPSKGTGGDGHRDGAGHPPGSF